MRPGSLRAQLVLLGMVVALLAVVVTAFAVQRLTTSDIRGSIERDLDAEISIRDSLAFFGVERGSWDGIEDDVAELARAFDERIAVATLDGTILADSEQLLFDQAEPLPVGATILDPSSELIPFAVPDDVIFEQEVQNGILLLCLDEAGIEAEVTDDQFGFPTIEIDDAYGPDEAAVLDACLMEAEFGLLDETDFLGGITVFGTGEPAELAPLQLFIGYATEGDGLLPNATSPAFWLALAAVFGVAIAVTVVLAARIAKPIDALTDAAGHMADGNLDTRVEVEGADELVELASAFNEMAASLQAEDQARRTLTTDVAHELRTPLANLRGYLEGIQDGIVEPEPHIIDSLHDEATSLQRLVTDLQQLSVAEAARIELRSTPTDIGELLERVRSSHLARAEAGGIALAVDADPGTITDTDPERLRQVLNNLVSNALRHTPPNGSVTMALVRDGPTLEIQVTDTGTGIAPEHLPHIFERFYRADGARSRSTGGTGLGLAISKALAEALGGSLRATNEPGVGTRFTLSLPSVAPTPTTRTSAG